MNTDHNNLDRKTRPNPMDPGKPPEKGPKLKAEDERQERPLKYEFAVLWLFIAVVGIITVIVCYILWKQAFLQSP